MNLSNIHILIFSLLSYSYICNLRDDKILVFGGYDTNK
jgi:hypothetical protein